MQFSLPVDIPQHFAALDVETRYSAAEVGGWHKAHLMGISVAVVYDSRTDNYFSYTQDEIPQLREHIGELPLVVGFNIVGFDYKVLEPHGERSFKGIRTVDMLTDIHKQLGFRVSLDNLSGATLGSEKSANGMLALTWWKEQKLDKIEEYCRKDVELTKDLYLFGKEHGHVFFTDKAGRRQSVSASWAKS